eukprot:SAG31_NODE_2355_length_5879_cov_6.732526_4_plen_70_part_00
MILERIRELTKCLLKFCTIEGTSQPMEANGVIVWLTIQSYNRIPSMIRKVANGIIAFKLKKCQRYIIYL